MSTFNLNINGKVHKVDADPTTPLLWILRDHLDLVGTLSTTVAKTTLRLSFCQAHACTTSCFISCVISGKLTL